MSIELVSLCSNPRAVMRDGWVGKFAKVQVPWLGFVYASGAHYSYPGSVMAQDASQTIQQTNFGANTYTKDCCSGGCNQGS